MHVPLYREILVLASIDQLEKLDRDFGIANLEKAGVLRKKGFFHMTFVLKLDRPLPHRDKKNEPLPPKRRKRRPPEEGRWGSSS